MLTDYLFNSIYLLLLFWVILPYMHICLYTNSNEQKLSLFLTITNNPNLFIYNLTFVLNNGEQSPKIWPKSLVHAMPQRLPAIINSNELFLKYLSLN